MIGASLTTRQRRDDLDGVGSSVHGLTCGVLSRVDEVPGVLSLLCDLGLELVDGLALGLSLHTDQLVGRLRVTRIATLLAKGLKRVVDIVDRPLLLSDVVSALAVLG